MCAAVLFEVRPENDTCTRNVSATSSSVTIAKPVPADGVAGFSLAPDRIADKVMVVAWDTVAQSMHAANANRHFFIAPPSTSSQEVRAVDDKRLSAAILGRRFVKGYGRMPGLARRGCNATAIARTLRDRRGSVPEMRSRNV